MTDEDKQILRSAINILEKESNRNIYDTNECKIFWKAIDKITESIEKANNYDQKN